MENYKLENYNLENYSNKYSSVKNVSKINNIDDIYLENENNNMDMIPLTYFHNKCFKLHCNNDNFVIQDFEIIYNIIESLNLTNLEKNLILVRFRRINLYCIKNYKSIANYYTKSKIFIIICGILNPSLLSINNDQEEKHYTFLFWTVWSLQLLVSLITSFVSFYKWDKKYFLYSSYKSKINQEIWLYLELTGRYSINYDSDIYETNADSNHKNKFNLFMERLEYLFKKLKDFDLEIETNDEESKDSYKKMFKKQQQIINQFTPNNESPFDLNEKENIHVNFSKQSNNINNDNSNHSNNDKNDTDKNDTDKNDTDKNDMNNEENKNDENV